jgi:hypothetical protein
MVRMAVGVEYRGWEGLPFHLRKDRVSTSNQTSLRFRGHAVQKELQDLTGHSMASNTRDLLGPR